MEKGLTKQEVITQLTKAVHAGGVTKRKKGEKAPKLTWEQKRDAKRLALTNGYTRISNIAIEQDEHFFARLIAWNHHKGEVRDAKVALPVIGLQSKDAELMENALAHMADLRPREFLRAVEFTRELKVKRNTVRRLVERWLRDLEAHRGEWERTALLHRATLRTLYSLFHTKPVDWADEILFKERYAPGSRFQRVKDLRNQQPLEIAGTIRELKLPWLIVKAALGDKLKDPDVLAAAVSGMTTTEVVTNMKTLEKLGVKDHAITRAALEQAIGSATSRKTGHKATLKAGVAADALEAAGDEQGAGKLRLLQEKQLDELKGVDGDWLVLGDMSPSMEDGVAKAVEVAAVLARLVRGRVILGFFNDTLVTYDVTGKSLAEIQKETRFVKAGGSGTRAYVGLDWLMENKIAVGGIAIVGDGGENKEREFGEYYARYAKMIGSEPSVYFFKLKPGGGYAAGHSDTLTGQVAHMQTFDIRAGVDYTSLPNLVQMMRVGRYSLLDEVMNTKLATLDEVLDRTKGFKVIVERELAHA